MGTAVGPTLKTRSVISLVAMTKPLIKANLSERKIYNGSLIEGVVHHAGSGGMVT